MKENDMIKEIMEVVDYYNKRATSGNDLPPKQTSKDPLYVVQYQERKPTVNRDLKVEVMWRVESEVFDNLHYLKTWVDELIPSSNKRDIKIYKIEKKIEKVE
jgi:hypothetical protein